MPKPKIKKGVKKTVKKTVKKIAKKVNQLIELDPRSKRFMTVKSKAKKAGKATKASRSKRAGAAAKKRKPPKPRPTPNPTATPTPRRVDMSSTRKAKMGHAPWTNKAAQPKVNTAQRPLGMSPRRQKDPTRRPKAKTYKEYHSERYRRESESGALPKDKLQPPGPPSQKKIRKSVLAGMKSRR